MKLIDSQQLFVERREDEEPFFDHFDRSRSIEKDSNEEQRKDDLDEMDISPPNTDEETINNRTIPQRNTETTITPV